MPETRTVKGFSEVGLPLVEGDFECTQAGWVKIVFQKQEKRYFLF